LGLFVLFRVKRLVVGGLALLLVRRSGGVSYGGLRRWSWYSWHGGGVRLGRQAWFIIGVSSVVRCVVFNWRVLAKALQNQFPSLA